MIMRMPSRWILSKPTKARTLSMASGVSAVGLLLLEAEAPEVDEWGAGHVIAPPVWREMTMDCRKTSRSIESISCDSLRLIAEMRLVESKGLSEWLKAWKVESTASE